MASHLTAEVRRNHQHYRSTCQAIKTKERGILLPPLTCLFYIPPNSELAPSPNPKQQKARQPCRHQIAISFQLSACLPPYAAAQHASLPNGRLSFSHASLAPTSQPTRSSVRPLDQEHLRMTCPSNLYCVATRCYRHFTGPPRARLPARALPHR